MIEIRDLVVDFKCLDRENFLLKHGVPFILHQTDQAIDPQRDFHVKRKKAASRKPTAVALNPTLEIEVAAHVAGVLAFELRPQKAGADRVTVGRTDTNDVQIPYDKVSMDHGFFQESDGGWSVTDAESTNGTWVNGEKIPKNQAVGLDNGAEIKLGTAEVVFYSPEGFYEYLSGLMAKIEKRA